MVGNPAASFGDVSVSTVIAILVMLPSTLSVLTTDKLTECFKNDTELSKYKSNGDHRHLMALGITHNCYMYYGKIFGSSGNPKPIEGGGEECKDKKIFRIRSYGDTQDLVILVDRFGQRVRVQPALSKKPRYNSNDTGGTVWHYVNTRNRLEHFYSDSVDTGFTINGFLYIAHRVLVYAVSYNAVRFYDLRIHIGNNYITPYLDLLAEPKLQFVYPHPELKILNYHKIVEDSSEVIIHQGDGHVFVTKLSDNIITVRSMANHSFRPREESQDSLSKSEMCASFGEPFFFEVHDDIAPDEWMLVVSTRRWVNPMHAHRRMSYPHAIIRMKQHHFFSKGWARALPIVVANILILLVGTLVFLRLVGYYNREYRKRRFGTDTSFSVLSH